MFPEWKLSSCTSSLMALSCGSVQGGLSQHKPQRTGLTGEARSPGHLYQWCWRETSCASARSCAGRGASWVACRSYRQGSPAWLAALPAVVLPPCSAIAQHACLLPPCFSADHGRAGSLGTQGGGISMPLALAALCSSRPPSLAISPSPSGHWFWLGLFNPCSKDKLSTTKYMQC